MVPIIRDVQAAGHTSFNAIAGQLNARKVATVNGGGGGNVQVRQIFERTAVGARSPAKENTLTGHIPLKRITATLI